MLKHPFRPGQANAGMTGNVWSCCDKPAAEHPEWRAGEVVWVRLKVDVTTTCLVDGRYVSRTFRRGNIVQATKGTYEPLYVIDEWAKDPAEEYTMVEMPDWSWPTGERMSVAIPWHQATEV